MSASAPTVVTDAIVQPPVMTARVAPTRVATLARRSGVNVREGVIVVLVGLGGIRCPPCTRSDAADRDTDAVVRILRGCRPPVND
jgi:hypothetical protein